MMTHRAAEIHPMRQIILVFSGLVAATLNPIGSNVANAAEAAAKSEWRPASCPFPPGPSSGPSSIAVTGPCAFEHKGTATCEAKSDDYNVIFSRNAKGAGNTALLRISVEDYSGAGRYKNNEILLSVYDKTKMYRWTTEKAEITIGPDSEYLIVHDAKLEPEPVLVDCTGPHTNYNCRTRGDEPQLLKTFPVVSGKIVCEPAEAKKK